MNEGRACLSQDPVRAQPALQHHVRRDVRHLREIRGHPPSASVSGACGMLRMGERFVGMGLSHAAEGARLAEREGRSRAAASVAAPAPPGASRWQHCNRQGPHCSHAQLRTSKGSNQQLTHSSAGAPHKLAVVAHGFRARGVASACARARSGAGAGEGGEAGAGRNALMHTHHRPPSRPPRRPGNRLPQYRVSSADTRVTAYSASRRATSFARTHPPVPLPPGVCAEGAARTPAAPRMWCTRTSMTPRLRATTSQASTSPTATSSSSTWVDWPGAGDGDD